MKQRSLRGYATLNTVGSNIVLLTQLEGGAFANREAWINAAMGRRGWRWCESMILT
jgi:hypothetical protein